MVYYNPLSPEAVANQNVLNRDYSQDLKNATKFLQEQRLAAEGAVRNNALFPRGAMLSGALLQGLGGVQRMGEGEVGEGLGQVIGGGTGAVAAGAIANRALRNANPLVGLAATTAASIFGGNVAGNLSAAVGGFAEDKVGAVTGRGDSRGAQRKRILQDAETAAQANGIMASANLATQVAAMTDLNKNFQDAEYLQTKRMLPLINQLQNQALVRQQQLNASNAQNYMNMGVVATAGRLAEGAQAQMGETLRTAITSNPYADSVLKAPQISFG